MTSTQYNQRGSVQTGTGTKNRNIPDRSSHSETKTGLSLAGLLILMQKQEYP
jgi:hypothetical protein